MTTMDIHQILKKLPHRYPILLVDRVLELEKGVRINFTLGFSARHNHLAAWTQPGALDCALNLYRASPLHPPAADDAGTVKDTIIAAAQAAGAHELILRLPGGYDHQLGLGGSGLVSSEMTNASSVSPKARNRHHQLDFLPEERPEEVASELLAFLDGTGEGR